MKKLPNLLSLSLFSLNIFLVLILFSACSKENIEYKYPKSIEDRRKDRAGNLLDDKNSGGKILKFSNILGGSKNSASSNINNSVLWQATIQTVAEVMPIASSDVGGGLIITDWFSLNSSQGERFKFNIILTNTELSPASIEIAGFRQVYEVSKSKSNIDNRWVDKQVNQEVVASLKEKILRKAKQILATKN